MYFTKDLTSVAVQLLLATCAVNASPLSKTTHQYVNTTTIQEPHHENPHPEKPHHNSPPVQQPHHDNSHGQHPRRDDIFTVHQVENPLHNGTAHNLTGPIAQAAALIKFGGKPHHDLLAALASKALNSAFTGSDVAIPLSYDSAYICPVAIGTPPQILNLDFDTGSSDLWVFSSETPKSQVSGQTVFKIGSSRTAQKDVGQTWAISYGDGSSSSGDVYLDTVIIGGVIVKSQAIESAQTVSASFTSRSTTSGLLGLGFSSINTVTPTQQHTWFDNAKSVLANPLFTANLRKGKAGLYTFGHIDNTQHTGAITYAPVNTANGFWEFTGSGYQVGTSAFVSTSIDAVVDTGTTLMLMPQSIVTAYYAKVAGAAYNSAYSAYTYPCNATLPAFSFGIGSYRATIPGNYMEYAPISTTTCYGGLQANTGLPFALLGDIFIKSQFVVFDAGNTRVGFASKPL